MRSGGAPRLAIAARDQHFPARPAARLDDDASARRCRARRASGSDLIGIDEGAPLKLDLRIESVSEGVLVTGTVSGADVGECARCLTPITGDVEIDLTELFAYPDSATDEHHRVGRSRPRHRRHRRPRAADHRRDRAGAAVLAAVRRRTVQGCARSAACRWPPPEPGHHHEQIDPRWAKLAAASCDRRTDRVSVDRAPLLKALGVDLPDELLTIALTHRSYSYENGGLPTNERLEFLGDAVLGLAITEELYHRHPDRSEGDLAKLRASVVNTQALADVRRGICPTTASAPTCCWARARSTPAAPTSRASWPTASNPCWAQSIWSTAPWWPVT